MADKPTDNKLTPKERSAQKQRDKITALTGITFEGELGGQLAAAVDDMLRTGLRPVDPYEEMPLHCGAEYHLARLSGPGATVAPLLYSVSMRIASESGNFFPSLKALAPYLNSRDEETYAAAHLLVAVGLWEVIEAEFGKPVKYRPVPHDEWSQRHTGFCTRKWEFPHRDNDDASKLGAQLHGVLGETFPINVVVGWRKIGHSDEQILGYAKQFLKDDSGQGSGIGRRVRFGKYLRSKAGT